MPEQIYISYTSQDHAWAEWIAVTLRDNGFIPLFDGWSLGAGESAARWMDESLARCDRILGVFTDSYRNALYSSSERWVGCWDDPQGRRGFLIPVAVEPVTSW